MNRSAFLDMINGGIILEACTPFFTTSIIFLKFIWVEVRSRDKSWIFFPPKPDYTTNAYSAKSRL